VITAFFFVPVAASVLLSFTDFDIYSVANLDNLRIVGPANYRHLFDDGLFWIAVRNTLYFVVVAAPLSIAVSFGAALLLNTPLTRLKPAFRAALFLPVVTTLVAVAVVWRYAFHPRIGLLNTLLASLGIGPVDWLGEPRFALPAIILMTIWKNFGFNMVILVAGLQSIPERLYEAARMDGAGAASRFRHVTLPDAAPDPRVRDRHDADRRPAALRRALRHDPGRPGARDALGRAADVPGRASAGGTWATRRRSRSCCSRRCWCRACGARACKRAATEAAREPALADRVSCTARSSRRRR
jgi:ABC-type spermidine/putrescine transport system permease subunit II